MSTKPSPPQINVNESMQAVFSDPNWMFKTGIGGILVASSLVALLYSLASIPLVAAFAAVNVGYNLRLMRQQATSPESKLPDWNDWSDLFVSGMTWIALQTCFWLLSSMLMAGIIAFTLIKAYGINSPVESFIWIAVGGLSTCFIGIFLSLTSSFLMVHFALEENVRAGFAYLAIAKRLVKQPKHYFLSYLISIGLQYSTIVIPLLSVLGIFLIPSSAFVGQLTSSSLLARSWSNDTDD